MKTINQIEPLVSADSGLERNFVRLNSGWIDSKRLDKQRFFRREALVIKNPENKQWVLRYALGSPPQQAVKKGVVRLDYDAIDTLGVPFGQPVALTVRRAYWHEQYRWAWNHHDLNARLAMRLGLLGFVLGLLGVMPMFANLLGF